MEQDSVSILWKSLAAGAIAGCTVDVVLFPLDSIKTRLQSKAGCSDFFNLRKAYRGVPVVMLGNSVGSAVFFATYEESKRFFMAPAGRWEAVLADSASAASGELVACIFRTPTEILKQRMQTLQAEGITEGVRDIHAKTLGLGFRATALRDLVFSAIQYPAYEYLKVVVSRDERRLSAWESALCGSVTGSCTAVLTTPLDVVKTRIMLDQAVAERRGGILAEISEIHRVEGWRGFFHGAVCRGLWMGLGGLLFLGSYEKAKETLKDDSPELSNFAGRYAWSSGPITSRCQGDARQASSEFTYRRCWYTTSRQPADTTEKRDYIEDMRRKATDPVEMRRLPLNDPFAPEVQQTRRAATAAAAAPAGVAATPAWQAAEKQAPKANYNVVLEMVAGGVAGCTVDVGLHPIDTLKTRLQASNGFMRAGGFNGIWRGVSAPALAGLPASALFWAVYEPMKRELYWVTGSHTNTEVISGPISELASLLVRVPSEVLKQRMQAGMHSGSLTDLVRQVYRNEGLSGFYAGFAATCYRSLPFAFIQFPIYEELKRQMAARARSGNAWWIGGASGALAGGVAGIMTTPLDVVKTRIMLSPHDARPSYPQAAWRIVTEEGMQGVFAGALPRALYLSLGGMIYLGVYNLAKDFHLGSQSRD